MCLILTIVMFILAVQNLMQEYWMTGSLQLMLSFAFMFLLWRNIQQVSCDKNGNCNNCMLPAWLTKFFTKKREE